MPSPRVPPPLMPPTPSNLAAVADRLLATCAPEQRPAIESLLGLGLLERLQVVEESDFLGHPIIDGRGQVRVGGGLRQHLLEQLEELGVVHSFGFHTEEAGAGGVEIDSIGKRARVVPVGAGNGNQKRDKVIGYE